MCIRDRVGVALFCHEDAIHAHGNVSKDGVTEIVDAVGVCRIVGIGVGQIGHQPIVPSCWICQAYFDFEAERIGIVIIIGAWNGEGDGLDTRQGGLKLHLPRGFVPIIHIKQTSNRLSDMMPVSYTHLTLPTKRIV